MSLDQLMYEWVSDTLNGNVSAGIVRRDQDESNQSEPPRVTYIPIEPTEELAGGARVLSGVLQIRVESNRPGAFGTGDNPEHAGELHDLLDAVDALLDEAVPVLSGYNARALRKVRERDGDGSTDIAARTLVYQFQVSEGFDSVPLAGDEGSLVLTGYDGEVQRWEVYERKPLNNEMTARDDSYMKYELGDKTAGITIWFMPLETDIMFPALGATTGTFTIHAGASFSDTIKIHDRRWGQVPGSPDIRAVVMQGVFDDDASPFLTGVIP